MLVGRRWIAVGNVLGWVALALGCGPTRPRATSSSAGADDAGRDDRFRDDRGRDDRDRAVDAATGDAPHPRADPAGLDGGVFDVQSFAAHDFASALGPCVPLAECTFAPAATYDARDRTWFVFTTVATGTLTRSFWFARAWRSSARSLLEGSVIVERIPEIERALAPARALPATPNLIVRGRHAESKVARHVPLVRLGPPLDGAELEVGGADITHREHTISWRRAGGGEKRALGKQPAAVGSCDDTDWCRAHEGGCRSEELAAEGRLCVLPLSILYVGLAPGRDSIAVLLREHSRSEHETRDHYWIGALPVPE